MEDWSILLLGGEFLDYTKLEKVLPVSEIARYHAMLGVELVRIYGLCNYVCPLCESGIGGPVEKGL